MKLQPILDKLSQESTWRGLISFATLFGVAFNPDQWAAITAAGVSLVSLINIFKND
jgi:hypothetical protein